MPQPSPEEQRNWRAAARNERAARNCITVHLDRLDAATLDAIAIQLYLDNPHDPRLDKLSDVRPSRPEAIQYLLSQWRGARGVDVGAPINARTSPLLDAIQLLMRARRKLSVFWRNETSWRQTRHPATLARKPRPPWNELVSDELRHIG
jgi:hypothetical protein